MGWGCRSPGWGDSAGAPGSRLGCGTGTAGPSAVQLQPPRLSTALDSLQPSTDILQGQLTQSPHSPQCFLLCSRAQHPPSLALWLKDNPGMHTVYEASDLALQSSETALNDTSASACPA